jgi:hypothetical protein
MRFRFLYSLFLPAAIAVNFIAHSHEHLGHLLGSHDETYAINFVSHHIHHVEQDHQNSDIEVDAYCDLCQGCEDQSGQQTLILQPFLYDHHLSDFAQSKFKTIRKSYLFIRAPPKVTFS